MRITTYFVSHTYIHHLIIYGCVLVPPTLLGSGDVRTLTVPVNGHLTLECLADSDPPPDIEWYKDEVKIQVQGQQKFKKQMN